MRLPGPRGPLSTSLLQLLDRPAGEAGADAANLEAAAESAVATAPDVLADDDAQLSLHLLYELHYRGLDGVDDRWEWQPGLLAGRAVLERAVEEVLREVVLVPEPPAPRSREVAAALFRMAADDDSPSLSGYVDRRASLEQVREWLALKSVYHLREADSHTWAVPRLHGRAKAALVEIQADEYGGGRPERMHSALFARTLRAAGVDDTYGAHVDVAPAEVLASGNVMSLFGLHRRLRAAAVGHLAMFEMTSSLPNRRYGNGLRRLGLDADATWFFDEHVEADAVHEQVAAHDMAGALVEEEPHLLPDLLLGAAAALHCDGRVADRLLGAWQCGGSALRGDGNGAAAARGDAA